MPRIHLRDIAVGEVVASGVVASVEVVAVEEEVEASISVPDVALRW